MFLKFVFSIVVACIFTACGYAIHKPMTQTGTPPTEHKASELTYASVYNRVFRPSCVRCHGDSGGVNLETYERTKLNLDKIKQSVFVDRTMPKAPEPSLSAEQMSLLNAWLKAGAPETDPGDDTPPVPPLGPTFELIKYHILEPKCLSCHTPGKPAGRISLVTKEDIVSNPLELAIPGNPDESGLVLAITSENPNKIMPPSKDAEGNPTGFGKLSALEIQAIYDWINNGAKD